MTREEQKEVDDLMRAQIAKIYRDIASDKQRIDPEIAKLNAETTRLQTEMLKLQAETIKLTRESAWYPFVVGTAFTGAIIGLTKLFL